MPRLRTPRTGPGRATLLRGGSALLTLTGALILTGCPGGRTPTATPVSARPATADTPRLEDVTAASGVRFTHTAGASGQHYFVETMGAGVAFFDYDGDGRQDLLFVNSSSLPGYKEPGPFYPALYRNLGNGKFQDVTAQAGLAVDMYAMGVAAGDYDNDGDDDLYVTCVLGPSRLFRNEGGRFKDVAAGAGVDRPASFPTSAAWVDYNRDGRLDLYVCNYVRYRSVEDDIPCYFKAHIRSYCIPFAYKAETDCLYENLGNGKFRNVAAKAGVEGKDGKSLGVAVCDLNHDLWPDLVIANDTTPTYAYINQKDGTFREDAPVLGLAYGINGGAKAGMGIDVADERNKGLPSVVMSNFSSEMVGFYRDTGEGVFREESVESGIGRPSEQLLGFGIFFFDYNNDGWLDLLVANGHVQDQVHQFTEGVTYKEKPLLYRNRSGSYENIAPQAGPGLQVPLVARGAAWGDFDDDGRLDAAINNNQGPALLLHNVSEGTGHWLKVRLVGTKSNRSGFGARVSLRSSVGTQTRFTHSGGSYCSQSDSRLHFGLGGDTSVPELKIEWPSGTVDTLRDLSADRLVTVREGEHG